MPVGAVIGGVATLGGAAVSAYGATDAAKIQAKAAGKAAQLQQPFTNIGTGAITTLGQLYGIGPDGQPTGNPFSQQAIDAFSNSPDYKYALQQGLQGTNFGNAAMGQLLSGNNMHDLTSTAEGLATQNFGNYANRLMQMAQLGQSAATGQGNMIANQGTAQASGVVGATNAINGGLSGVANNLMFYNLMQGLKGGGGSAYGNNSLASASFANPSMTSGMQSVMM